MTAEPIGRRLVRAARLIFPPQLRPTHVSWRERRDDYAEQRAAARSNAAIEQFEATATPAELAAAEADQDRLNRTSEQILDRWVRERDGANARGTSLQPSAAPVAVVERPQPRAREHGRSATRRSSSGSDDSDPSDERDEPDLIRPGGCRGVEAAA